MYSEWQTAFKAWSLQQSHSAVYVNKTNGSALVDISCLTRDIFVHHTLKYKRLFNGDVSKQNSNLLYMYVCFSC